MRLTQLQLLRGESPRHKLLLVQGLSPEAAFAKVTEALNREHVEEV